MRIKILLFITHKYILKKNYSQMEITFQAKLIYNGQYLIIEK